MFALRIIDSDYSQFYALKSPRKQVAKRWDAIATQWHLNGRAASPRC